MSRWLKFNAAGAVGVAVQLLVLMILKIVLKLHYLTAAAIAVEAAILQNFFWHQRFTWADRPRSRRLRRFLKFNLSSGAISILGNIAVMRLLVGRFHINYLLSNAISIAGCSVANFLASDLFVFRRESETPLPRAASEPARSSPTHKTPPLRCQCW